MNTVIKNKIGMYQKVSHFMGLHGAETTNVPAVAPLSEDFNTRLDRILLLSGLADTDITGYTVEKSNKREALIVAILKISTAFTATQKLLGKPQFAERFDETLAKLQGMRDGDVYTYSQSLFEFTKDMAASLQAMGITQDDIDRLGILAKEYLALVKSPQVQIAIRGANIMEVEKLMGEADIALNKLDSVMELFQFSNTVFYNSYKNLRYIDHTPTRSSPDYEDVVLPGATKRVDKFEYTPGRNFTIKNMGDVSFTIWLGVDETSKPDYVLLVRPGETLLKKAGELSAVPADHLMVRNDDLKASAYYAIVL